MKNTISGFCEFSDKFRDMDRKSNFSYSGLKALYEYLIDYEDSIGEEIELDVIALCCEYTEYEDFEEIKGNYWDLKNMDDLRDHTQVIEFDGGIIIQNY